MFDSNYSQLYSSGDIRNGINSLQFHSVTVGKLTEDKKKKKKRTLRSSLARDSDKYLGGRDTALQLFHAVGKIIYCKSMKLRYPFF